MKSKLILSLCAASVITISGCTTVAEMAGADSSTLNVAAAQGFNKTVQEASANKTLDTTSATYKRINSVFMRLKPYGDQLNQTGKKFDWRLDVLKSYQVNGYVEHGGKVIFYTEVVNKFNLTDEEIATEMGHEMVQALVEQYKNKIGQRAVSDLALR